MSTDTAVFSDFNLMHSIPVVQLVFFSNFVSSYIPSGSAMMSGTCVGGWNVCIFSVEEEDDNIFHMKSII